MERRSLLAIVLCFLIFMGWQKFYIGPRMPVPKVATQSVVASGANQTSANLRPAESVPEKPKRPARTVDMPLSTGEVTLNDGRNIFGAWNLKKYRLADGHVNLKSVVLNDGAGELGFDLPEYAYLTEAQGDWKTTPNGGTLWVFEDANVRLTREFAPTNDRTFVDFTLTAEFKNKKPNYAFVSLVGKGWPSDPEAQDRQVVYWSNNSIGRQVIGEKGSLREIATPLKWIGATNRYFLMTLVSTGALEPKGLLQSSGSYEQRVSMVYPVAGSTISIPLRAYFGPKEIDAVRGVEPTLDHTIDFGWFTVFAYPLLRIMKWFHGLFGNWGVAIILLTLLVKLVTFPLTYKSMKSMKHMAKLQPQIQKLKEKYGEDKEALNREMLTMMRTHGYNPAAGCLPILIQMPVFFALYKVLYSSIELYQAPFIFWIQDLSLKDPFYVTPILLTATMYIQQKLTPNTATDPAQQKMLQFMPVIFGVMMVTLASGLTLYMLINAVASIVQQLILNKKLDAPNVTVLPARAR